MLSWSSFFQPFFNGRTFKIIVLIPSKPRRFQWSRGLRREVGPLACWDCWFESRWGRGCLSVVCRVVSETSRSLFQSGLSNCGTPLCVIRNVRNEAAVARVGLLRRWWEIIPTYESNYRWEKVVCWKCNTFTAVKLLLEFVLKKLSIYK